MSARLTHTELQRLCTDIRSVRAFAFLTAPAGHTMACERGGLAALITLLVGTLAGQQAADLVDDALCSEPTIDELQAELPHAEMAMAQRAKGAAQAAYTSQVLQ